MHRDLSARLVIVIALTLALPATSLAQDATTSADTSDSTLTSSTPTPSVSPASSMTETDCTNHADDDGDGLADCADADCFEARECRAGGRNEGDEATCTDWIDNDGDGFVDSGDIVELRGDRYYFVGRRGGIINIGGLKVHPEEIEAVGGAVEVDARGVGGHIALPGGRHNIAGGGAFERPSQRPADGGGSRSG